jgi:predicted glycoside hydrolase/deacetylase ChbG (UPF0249 family)
MVFMRDSERAAALAQANSVDVGLHLNFAEQFTGASLPSELLKTQDRLVSYLMGSRYAQLLYNPFLRRQFSESLRAQLDEFDRLYHRPPTHIDGHHHMHLCANMLLAATLPAGSKVRRNFSFWPGEKSALNRAYRRLVDRWLQRRHRMVSYFFDLGQCLREDKLSRVAALAKATQVELMTHPILTDESEFLLGKQFSMFLQSIPTGSYAVL